MAGKMQSFQNSWSVASDEYKVTMKNEIFLLISIIGRNSVMEFQQFCNKRLKERV
jgi:hypothetical protein